MNPYKRTEPPAVAYVNADQRFLTMRAEIIDRLNEGEIPSVTVGAIKDGQVIWCESLGWSDKENGIAATPDTPYGLASLGKSITATAVMVLVDQRKVDLNAPVSQYIGNDLLTVYEGEMDQVTVQHVLNMTAAIPHGGMVFKDEADFKYYSIDKLLQNRGIVVFPPGEISMYSNISYAVLEKLIENVSGKTYPLFLETEIFDPLGMYNSFCLPNNESDRAAYAAPYDEKGIRTDQCYMLPRNSLGLYASVKDLLNFGLFHIQSKHFEGNTILHSELLEKMHHLRANLPGSLIALGMASIEMEDGQVWLLTNGRAVGLQATLSMIPSEGVAGICLVNSTGQTTDEIAFRICEVLVPGFMDRAGQIIAEYEAWATRPYEESPDLIGLWHGVIFASENQVKVNLQINPGGEILIQIDGNPFVSLIDVRVEEGLLTGEFNAVLPMEEGQDGAHIIHLSLRMKDSRLSGFVTSDITNEKGNYSLAAYVRLSKI